MTLGPSDSPETYVWPMTGAKATRAFPCRPVFSPIIS